MRIYLKKEFGLIEGKRLSHIWHMSGDNLDKALFITDGALNVAPRIEVKLHILKNVIEFANKTGLTKPKVAILSANYLSKRLEGHYKTLYKDNSKFVAHECILDTRCHGDGITVRIDDAEVSG